MPRRLLAALLAAASALYVPAPAYCAALEEAWALSGAPFDLGPNPARSVSAIPPASGSLAGEPLLAPAPAQRPGLAGPPPAPPERRWSPAMTWIGNLTWGSVNSAFGLALTAVLLPWLAFGWAGSGRFPIRMSPTGEQIFVDTAPYDLSAVSLGVFHIGGNAAHRHETGHARQSAILGPFYLAFAVLSYIAFPLQLLLTGGKVQAPLIERWADQLAP